MFLRLSLILVLGLCVLCPSPASADDGYAGGVGQTPVPRNSKNIVMESEVVNIVLHEGFAEVECAYRFRNDGNDQVVMMGFPNPTSPESEEYAPRNLGISIFKVFIDGVEVPVKATTMTLKPSHPEIRFYGEKSNWYMHNVSFKAGETKVVVNRYIAPHGVTASPEVASNKHFSYILRTGSTWKGTIGRADINVSFASGLSWANFTRDPDVYKEPGERPPGNPSEDIIILPGGYEKNVNGFSWIFTDFEPESPLADTDEIHIGFYLNLKKTGPRMRAASASTWLNAGEYKYPAIQAFDDNVNTAWAEGSPGSGIGEFIKVAFNKSKEISEIRILPGYTKRNDLFYKYSRPKTATITFSNGMKRRILLDDDPRVQYFSLDRPIMAKWAKITIDEVYRGNIGEDTYISEIEFGSTLTHHPAKATELLSRISPSEYPSHVITTTTIKPSITSSNKKSVQARQSKEVASSREELLPPSKVSRIITTILLLGLSTIGGLLIGRLIGRRQNKSSS